MYRTDLTQWPHQSITMCYGDDSANGFYEGTEMGIRIVTSLSPEAWPREDPATISTKLLAGFLLISKSFSPMPSSPNSGTGLDVLQDGIGSERYNGRT